MALVSSTDGHEGDMVLYRCYILDADDHIVQAHDFDYETEAQAGSAAESLLALDPYHRAAEVWKATRRVLKLERDVARRRWIAHRAPPNRNRASAT
jgi:hypothetical protein